VEGGWEILLIKLNNTGGFEWNTTIGGSGNDRITDIIITPEGDFILGGHTRSLKDANDFDYWLLKTDANGEVWNQTYGGTEDDCTREIVLTSDGGIATIGATMSFGGGFYDFWLVKTDNRGLHQWNVTYGHTELDWGNGLIETQDNGLLCIGDSTTKGDKDILFLKVDSLGNILWEERIGGDEEDACFDFLQTEDGDFVICGYTRSFNVEGKEMWIIKTGTPEVTTQTSLESKIDATSNTTNNSSPGFELLLLGIGLVAIKLYKKD
jgi:hypothetical protein